MRKYEDLTHRGQFQRLGRLARTALLAYPIGPDFRLTPLRHIENTTFRVDDLATGRRYCLRVHRPGYQSIAAIRSEMQFLESLSRETDITVPRPVPTRHGDLLTTASTPGVDGERNVVLFEWVYGRFFRRGEARGMTERSGATLARLQDFAATFTPPPEFTRPRFDSDGFLGKTLERSFADAGELVPAGDREIIQRGYARAVDIREGIGRTPAVYGLIHADFHRGNFLVAPGGQIAVIDFDDFGWGHFLYDVAVATINYATNPARVGLCQDFLRGYRSVRAFSVGEEEMIPAFNLLRSVFMLQWFISRTDNPRLREWLPRHLAETVKQAKALLRE